MNQHSGNKSGTSNQTGKKLESGNSGNFKNDPERAAEAGRKGGQNSHGGGRKS